VKRNLDPLRRDAKKIFLHAIRAADPQDVLSSQVSPHRNLLRIGSRRYPLSKLHRIWVGGTGKASASMAVALERILGPRISGGLINVKYGHGQRLKKIRIQEAGHPLPDEKGLEGAREMVGMLTNLSENDLVIFLISGGGLGASSLPKGKNHSGGKAVDYELVTGLWGHDSGNQHAEETSVGHQRGRAG
jgi:glycerate 2-kinase